MSDLLRCPTCLGTKTVRGLGMIEKECYRCKGIGFVQGDLIDDEEEIESIATLQDEESSEIVIPKKRGRKKGVIYAKKDHSA